MKKALILLSLVLLTLNVFAQDQQWSATVAFPLAVGDYEYTGAVAFAAQYRFTTLGPVKIGASADIDYLTDTNTLASTTIKERTTLIQPRIFGELNLPVLSKFKPFLGVGYTFVNFKTKFDSGQTSDNENGLNVAIGGTYDITDILFVQLQFDITRVVIERTINSVTPFGEPLRLEDKTNFSIFKLGIGLRF